MCQKGVERNALQRAMIIIEMILKNRSLFDVWIFNALPILELFQDVHFL